MRWKVGKEIEEWQRTKRGGDKGKKGRKENGRKTERRRKI